MAVTPLCQQADVEAKLSEFGLMARLDDDRDGAIDPAASPGPTLADSVIENASAEVGQYLLIRYAAATLTASAWVKWVTATFAAKLACLRRGNPCPESLLDQVKEYVEQLKLIRDNRQALVTDTGQAPPRFNDQPTVSNLHIDGRFRRQKVRVVPQTSTGPQPQGPIERNETVDWSAMSQ